MSKNKINQRFLFVAAFFCLAAFAWEFSFIAGASAQQETTQRSRKVAAAPTPKSKATPKPTPAPKVSPVANPTATPTPAPAATPKPLPLQTLPELQSKIRGILVRPEFQRGQIGVKVVSLDSGKTLFEENAEKYFMPASNMKIFTVSAALVRLSPDFRFSTSLYSAAKPDADGVIRGDLTIYGRGDPSFSTAFYNGDHYKAIDNLADKIVQAGVKRIEGGLVGDESYFTDDAIPGSWEVDDLQWYYGAEISALTSNDNSIDLVIQGGSAVGFPCYAAYTPEVPGLGIIRNCVTAPAGTKRDIQINKRPQENLIIITGKIAVDDKGFTTYIALTRPGNMFVSLLRRSLEKKGVVITGKDRLLNAREKAAQAAASSVPWVELAKIDSPPLAAIAAGTLKPSQNLYTELILRAMGERLGDKTGPKKNSLELGVGVVDKFLKQVGIPDGSVLMYDASGLSRHNLITPNAVVQLYIYMNKSPYAGVWRDSLPVGGVDGTLKNRLKNTSAMNNVHAKTGTIDQVSSLSGYVTTASGEKLAFSIMTNAIPSQSLRQNTIDEIVLLLANYNGKGN